MKLLKLPEGATLQTLGRLACEAHADPQDARKAIDLWRSKNPELAVTMDAAATEYGYMRLIYHTRNDVIRRAKSFGSGRITEPRADRGAMAAVADEVAAETRLLDVWIGSKLLRDCTKSDLMESVEAHEQETIGSVASHLWKRAIAARLRGRQTVGKALSEAKLRGLWEAARREAESRVAGEEAEKALAGV